MIPTPLSALHVEYLRLRSSQGKNLAIAAEREYLAISDGHNFDDGS